MNVKACLITVAMSIIIMIGSTVFAQDFEATRWKSLEEYSEYIQDVEFSPKRNFLAATVGDGTVGLYDRGWRRVWYGRDGTPGSASRSAFSPDEKYLALSAYGKSMGDITILQIWDRRIMQTLTGHLDYVYSVSFSPNGYHLASASKDKTVKIWELLGGKFSEIQTLDLNSPVETVSFSPDGTYLAGGSDDNTVTIWKLTNEGFSELQTLRGHSKWILQVSFSPDGEYLASLSWDDTIRIWRLSNGQFLDVQTLTGHSGKILNISFSPDGNYLVGGNWDRTIKVWQLFSNEFLEIKTLEEHSDTVWSIGFSPDGKYLASGSGNGIIEIWRLTGVGVIPRPTIASIRAKQSAMLAAAPQTNQSTTTQTNTTLSFPTTASTTTIKPVQSNQTTKRPTNTTRPRPATDAGDFVSGLPPVLSIEEVTFSEEVLYTEEMATLTVRIKNSGDGDANDAYVQLTGYLEGLSFPLQTPLPKIEKKGGVRTVEIPVKGEVDLPNSEAVIDIQVIEPHFKVKIKGKPVQFSARQGNLPALILANFTILNNSGTPNGPIHLNENLYLKFSVKNIGSADAEKVSVEVKSKQSGVLLIGVVDENNRPQKRHPKFGKLAVDQSETIIYRFFINAEFEENHGNAPLEFTIIAKEHHRLFGFSNTKTIKIKTKLQPEREIRQEETDGS